MRYLNWIVLIVFVFFMAFGMSLGCECGDDDDDDDSGGSDGPLGDDDWGSGDCDEACENMFDCGAGLVWYTDMDECIEYCNDWLDTSIDCAECVLGCWVGDDVGCIDAGLCMAECALGPCVEELEEYVD